VSRRTLAAILGTAALAFAGSASAHGHDARTIRLTEAHKEQQPTFVDTGKPGPTVGDLAVDRDEVLRPDGSTAGTFREVCTLIDLGPTPPASTFECTGSLALQDGTITFEGPFVPSTPEQSAAITGGTGAYATARGEIVIRAVADEFVVRLER
jgi:Allene oxide cyclase barrel like domain